MVIPCRVVNSVGEVGFLFGWRVERAISNPLWEISALNARMVSPVIRFAYDHEQAAYEVKFIGVGVL